MTKPAAGKLFYVPQRPYMTIGTLRDQIIYPDTIGNMKRKGFTDDDLKDFLDKVCLLLLLYIDEIALLSSIYMSESH